MLALTAVFAVSCRQNADPVDFDTNKAYIYFSQPNPTTNAIEKFVDSISYSFALENPNLTEKVFAVPVSVSGVANGNDRRFTYRINPEKSSYDPALVEISEPVIRAGKFTDTLYVKVQKGAELRQTSMTLFLELVENEHFGAGHMANQTMKITFTNKLTQPTWWNTWRSVFGPFYPEVYELWIQIYYFGADPTLDLYNSSVPGPYYYWDRMPPSAVISWFPVTFMYIDVLRKYLEEHPVYPNGDTTQPRIYLP